ncbi:MAG TPA: hypothetical protein VGD46_19830 [Rhizobacter sp.]
MKASRIVKPLAAAVLASVLLGGCQGVPLDLSPRTVAERSQVDLTKGRRVSGEASGFQLMLFIPIAINSRYRNAYDELLKQAGDDLLADVTVIESWQWAFVGTVYTTRIEATAYPRLPAPPAAADGGAK